MRCENQGRAPRKPTLSPARAVGGCQTQRPPARGRWGIRRNANSPRRHLTYDGLLKPAPRPTSRPCHAGSIPRPAWSGQRQYNDFGNRKKRSGGRNSPSSPLAPIHSSGDLRHPRPTPPSTTPTRRQPASWRRAVAAIAWPCSDRLGPCLFRRDRRRPWHDSGRPWRCPARCESLR